MLVYFPLVKTKRPTGHFQLPVTCSEWKTYFSTHWNVKYYLFLLERQGWRFTQFCWGVQIRWDTCPAFQERNRTEILKASPIFAFHESSKPFLAIWASGDLFFRPSKNDFFLCSLMSRWPSFLGSKFSHASFISPSLSAWAFEALSLLKFKSIILLGSTSLRVD